MSSKIAKRIIVNDRIVEKTKRLKNLEGTVTNKGILDGKVRFSIKWDNGIENEVARSAIDKIVSLAPVQVINLNNEEKDANDSSDTGSHDSEASDDESIEDQDAQPDLNNQEEVEK